MPDITKCQGKDCPIKDLCYRFTAQESDLQMYFSTSPNSHGECKYFWLNNKKKAYNERGNHSKIERQSKVINEKNDDLQRH